MKVFACTKSGFAAVVVAFNRGQAVKLLAKELEARGLTLEKTDPVSEIPTDEKETRKGYIFILSEPLTGAS